MGWDRWKWRCSITKKIVIWIVGNQYIGAKDTSGLIYINLTQNDLIIPQSGHIAYVLEKKIIGLPPRVDNVRFVVDNFVLLMSGRKDLVSIDTVEQLLSNST